MISGVSFQPGMAEPGQRRAGDGGSSQGVQEAIKVLSLRLPKVVGARAVAPQPLLASQGSGGNPHVDSIVESVIKRIFPDQSGMQTPTEQPSGPSPLPNMDDLWKLGQQYEVPRFSGHGLRREQTSDENMNPWTFIPRIIAGRVPDTPPPNTGYTGDDSETVPDLRRLVDWVPQAPSEPEPPPMI